jgi:hypothetical protein
VNQGGQCDLGGLAKSLTQGAAATQNIRFASFKIAAIIFKDTTLLDFVTYSKRTEYGKGKRNLLDNGKTQPT